MNLYDIDIEDVGDIHEFEANIPSEALKHKKKTLEEELGISPVK